MKILLIGPGRIGTRLAWACREEGHTVILKDRNGYWNFPSDNSERVEKVPLSPAPELATMDAILLAVRSENLDPRSDSNAAEIISEINKAPPTIPVISVVATLGIEKLSKLFGERSYCRFLCSGAVGHPKAILYVDEDSRSSAENTLKRAIGKADWRHMTSDKFEMSVNAYSTAALHCYQILKFLNSAVEPISPRIQKVLIDSLLESHRMIEREGGDVNRALETAATPGGFVERLLAEFE